MSTEKKTILAIGVIQGPTPDWSKERVLATVEEGVAAVRALGFDCECYLLDRTDPSTFEHAKQLLKSRSWDGICIGFGVRGEPSLTGLFEELVNAAVGAGEGAVPKLMFPLNPWEFSPCAVRVFSLKTSP